MTDPYLNEDVKCYIDDLLTKIISSSTSDPDRFNADIAELNRRNAEKAGEEPPIYATSPRDAGCVVLNDEERDMLYQDMKDGGALPDRVQVLNEAAELTNGDRDKTYGPPHVNMAAAGRLKALMRELTTRDIGPAEQEALDLMLTKLARVIAGPEPYRENYVDGSAYFAIAYENAVTAEPGTS